MRYVGVGITMAAACFANAYMTVEGQAVLGFFQLIIAGFVAVGMIGYPDPNRES